MQAGSGFERSTMSCFVQGLPELPKTEVFVQRRLSGLQLGFVFSAAQKVTFFVQAYSGFKESMRSCSVQGLVSELQKN